MAVTSLKRPKAPDPIFVLRGHRTDTTAVAFLAQGNLLLSGDADGEIKLWDLKTRRPVSSVRGHSAHAGVIGLAVTKSDPSTFLSQGRDGVVKVWSLGESGLARQPLLEMRTGSYNFCKLALVEAPQLTSGQEPNFCIKKRDETGLAQASAQTAESIQSSRSESAGPADKVEDRTGRQSEKEAGARAPEASVEGNEAHASEADEEIEEREARASPGGLERSTGERRGGLAEALASNGSGLLSNGKERTADMSRETDGSSRELATSAGASPFSPAVESSNELIALAGADPSTIEIWDVRSGSLVQRLEQARSDAGINAGGVNAGLRTDTPSAGMCMSVQLRTGSDAVPFPVAVGGYEDGSILAWDLRSSGAPVFRQRLHSEPVLSLALDESGRGGVSGAADDKLTFFSLHYEQGQCIAAKEIGLDRPGIGDLALRDDQRIVATAGWDHRVRIFDYKRRTPLAVLRYHAAAVTAVSFSRGGHLLASASRDASIALWSIFQPTTGEKGSIL